MKHFILRMLFERFACAIMIWSYLRDFNCFHEGYNDINQPSLNLVISHFPLRKKKLLSFSLWGAPGLDEQLLTVF
jgi:hypothetical protein